MADDKLDISSIFGDTFKQISDALSGETQKKKTTKKKTTAKKSTSSKTSSALSSAGLKAANAGKTASKKASTAKKTTSTSAKKTTTSSKKSGTIMLEINGRQIDFKTIEAKAAKLGGNCYVVVNEKKIYNEDGKSVSLFS
ncbi:MAG: hypothetical protein IKT20_04310 [Clostridiales bacterium]|nr:hypothetical protein [Clostridiales bacterium]MBR6488109.1 hypothetical protein [Clostridiales bacterium]